LAASEAAPSRSTASNAKSELIEGKYRRGASMKEPLAILLSSKRIPSRKKAPELEARRFFLVPTI
jgi:hypothetical protein